jgi:ribulose 1,5-bisphosphate synthetase/thiazole synthase
MHKVSHRSYVVALISMAMITLNQSFHMGTTVKRAQLCKHGFSSFSTSSLWSTAKNICVIGGGLAGLSTTFHLLEKIPDARVAIIDKTDVGKGGASSVAGG